MKLSTKINLLLLGVFLAGLVVTGAVGYRIMTQLAQDEVADRARLMMQAALAMRGYTIDEIRPLLAPHMANEFFPQTVPAYAATQAFKKLRQSYSDYTYKEATINPTNPRDRAADWEIDLVQQFENHPDSKEISGVRETPTGPSLFLARPIQITNAACLACHSVPSAAPAPMLAQYGTANGFGWKLNQVVGAQIVSVPMAVSVKQGRQAFFTVMATVAAVFATVLLIVHFVLRNTVTKRLQALSNLADDVSKGNLDAPPFDDSSKDEVSDLGASFNRMRFSLQKAMKLLDET